MKEKLKINEKGLSMLLIILIVAFLSLLVQSHFVAEALNLKQDWTDSITLSNKNRMVYNIGEDLSQEIALMFSRYSSNAALEKCLKDTTLTCDERTDYDMVLYAPIGQQSFQGGTWPQAPAGAPLLAGGRTTNVALFRSSGARCPILGKTAADSFCPLQVIAEFKPLCGGTNSVPDFSIPGGGPCPGKATGFDITVGVARFMNGRLVYHKNTKPGGDAQIFRFPSSLFFR